MTHPLAFLLNGQDEDAPPIYQALVVEEMLAAKRAGLRFEEAWVRATSMLPPPPSFRRASTHGSESQLQFFRRHCEAAWHNATAAKPNDEEAHRAA